MVKWVESLVPIDFVSHDVVEVITSDKTVVIKVSLKENVVKLIFSKVFSQFLRNFLQLGNCNFSLN